MKPAPHGTAPRVVIELAFFTFIRRTAQPAARAGIPAIVPANDAMGRHRTPLQRLAAWHGGCEDFPRNGERTHVESVDVSAAAHGPDTERATRTCGYSGRRPDPCVLHEGVFASHGNERPGLLPDRRCHPGSSRSAGAEAGDSHATRDRGHPRRDAFGDRPTPAALPDSACASHRARVRLTEHRSSVLS